MQRHRNISIADQVFDKLENDILIGKYSKGEILTELGLSQELGVSRTPIREALSRLEQEHLIEYIPKGIKVVGISFEDIALIFDIRIRTEGLASRLAAKHATDEQLLEMKNTIDLQEFYLSKEDSENIKAMDNKFHDILYKMMNSMHFYQLLHELHKKTLKYRGASVQSKERAKQSVDEHRDIYNAILKRNENEAERLTLIHIENAKANILESNVE